MKTKKRVFATEQTVPANEILLALSGSDKHRHESEPGVVWVLSDGQADAELKTLVTKGKAFLMSTQEIGEKKFKKYNVEA